MYEGSTGNGVGATAAIDWLAAGCAGMRAWAASTWAPAAPAAISTALSVVKRKPDPLKAQEDNADAAGLPAPAVPRDVSQPLSG